MERHEPKEEVLKENWEQELALVRSFKCHKDFDECSEHSIYSKGLGSHKGTSNALKFLACFGLTEVVGSVQYTKFILGKVFSCNTRTREFYVGSDRRSFGKHEDGGPCSVWRRRADIPDARLFLLRTRPCHSRLDVRDSRPPPAFVLVLLNRRLNHH